MTTKKKIKMKAAREPAAPQVGFVLLFFDRVSRKLKAKKPNGSTVSLEG